VQEAQEVEVSVQWEVGAPSAQEWRAEWAREVGATGVEWT
jgi:hypothetical protein